MKIVFVEIVRGDDPAETSIKVHDEDPTDRAPISCLDESGNVVPVKMRRIVGIEIDKSIVRKFIETGFKPQTQEGLCYPVSFEKDAVIGKPMPSYME